MKFVYEYRTSDNVQHSAAISAPTRDAAFAVLREKGIRPIRLADAPGFFNKLFGKGKRWIAIGVLCVLCLVLCFSLYTLRSSFFTLHSSLTEPLARQQIYGDPAVLTECWKNNWAGVFAHLGDRLLAAYAEPGGRPPAEYQRPTRGASDFCEFMGDALDRALEVDSPPVDGDSEEVRKMKRIVAGMKDELRAYIADGGTSRLYVERLIMRQAEEIAIRQRISNELATAYVRGSMTAADQTAANRELRGMGLLPITDFELKRKVEEISPKPIDK